MLSSLLGLLQSSTQFALIRQSIAIRSVCHASTQQADVAPSYNAQIGAEARLYEPCDSVEVVARAAAAAAARARKATSLLYLSTRWGGRTKLLLMKRHFTGDDTEWKD